MKKSNRQRVHSNYYVEIVFFCNNNNNNNNQQQQQQLLLFRTAFRKGTPKPLSFHKKTEQKRWWSPRSPQKSSIERKRERDVVVKQHARRDGIAIVLKFFDGDGRVRLSRRPIRSSRFGCFRATDSNPKKELDCLDDAKIVRRFKLFRHVRSSRGVCYSREAGRD